MTPVDLIQLTLKVVRVLGQGQSATQQQLSDALTHLNMMMGQWARNRWLVFHLIDLKATGTGAASYALGPGGSFSITSDANLAWDASGITWDSGFRVNRIEKAYIRQNANTQQQVDIPLSVLRAYEDWAAIPAKNVNPGFPQTLFLDAGYPIATVNVYPAPTNAYEIHLLILNPLARFSALNVDIDLPDEYQEALVYNLARRLMSVYGKPMDAEINTRATSALMTVRNANAQIPLLAMPSAVLPLRGGGYNIYSDTNG